MPSKDLDFRDDRHFRRRLKAAKEGLHLPTEIELLRGMPFLLDDMASDVREFGERLSRRLKHKPKFEVAPLVASLDDLAIDQSVEALQCPLEAMEDANDFTTTSAHEPQLRIHFYLASCGDAEAAATIVWAVAALTEVRLRLTEEFPHAVAVIDDILRRLVGREHVHLRPTVLVGRPGCGKTRFARWLCEELAVPFELMSCGGMSDSAIGGTPRRWSSGEPSIAVMAIRRHHTAGPGVDEIEMVGTSHHNGNPHDVLIGLFEQETSQRWFDPYIESACDLSYMSWLMTANTLAGVPPVLLDRCRVIAFPEPGPDQLGVLAPRILERLYVDAGHDPRWATPLEPYEMAVLEEHWRGGSIRKLQQLLETLVETRERHRPRQ